MNNHSGDGGSGQDFANWRGDLTTLWVTIIEFVGLVTLTAILMEEGSGLTSWLIMLGALVIGWLLPVLFIVPRSASHGVRRQGRARDQHPG